MPSSNMELDSAATTPAPDFARQRPNWYAIHTVARHEKRVAQHMQENRVFTFLPLIQQIRQWSDRRAKVDVPLFGCYAFVRIVHNSDERLKVLRTPGVLCFVGNERQGTPIPNEQIEYLQTAIRRNIPLAVHPFLEIGKRVRIRAGSH